MEMDAEKLTREELSALEKNELIEIVLFLQKEAAYWKHRFNCVENEYDNVCFHYKIPRY